MVTEVTDSNITEILTQPTVVLQFTAGWCGPCKMISPIMEELSTDNPTTTIGKINVDENPTAVSSYGIRGIPAILFIKDGVVVDKIVGMTEKTHLQGKIDTLNQ